MAILSLIMDWCGPECSIHCAGMRTVLLVDIRVLVKRRKKTKKTLKNVMFDSQVSLKSKGRRVWKKKKKKKNIQEFRPGRSAMQ